MNGTVTNVDCTVSEGKALCDANSIKGYPTIKYGDPFSLDDYHGGRDFDSLSTFAKEHLKPICFPSNIHMCDKEKKVQIKELLAIPPAELDAKIASYEEQLKDAEEYLRQKSRNSKHLLKDLSKKRTARLLQ